MMVNGATSNRESIVWEQSVSVVPNTTYRFSVWTGMWSSLRDSPAVLHFLINDTTVAVWTSTDLGKWEETTATWSSGESVVAKITIVDLQLARLGNDFAVDDISLSIFHQAGPDGDRIPHTYEIRNGLDPFVDDASLDLDGDGSSNFTEYLFGTAANDSSSRPNLTIERANGRTVLGWPAVKGFCYRVESSSNLHTWREEVTLAARQTRGSASIVAWSQPARFYRVVALEP